MGKSTRAEIEPPGQTAGATLGHRDFCITPAHFVNNKKRAEVKLPIGGLDS